MIECIMAGWSTQAVTNNNNDTHFSDHKITYEFTVQSLNIQVF